MRGRSLYHATLPSYESCLFSNLAQAEIFTGCLKSLVSLLLLNNIEYGLVIAGTDTIGCVRIPAAFCGILGYRPSHGIVSNIGILMNSQSLCTVGESYT